jgi:hypothetical protein
MAKDSRTGKWWWGVIRDSGFHVPANMASCVFVRQKCFCLTKTQLALPSVGGGFLRSRKPRAAVNSLTNKSHLYGIKYKQKEAGRKEI